MSATNTSVSAWLRRQAIPDQHVRRSSFAQVAGQICFFSLLALSVTYPAITIREDLPRVKIEQVLLPAVLLVYGIFLLAGLVRPIRLNGMFLISLLFSVSIAVSMFYGADFLHYKLILRDYYEIPKAWFPALFFTVGYEAKLSEASYRRCLKALSIPVLLICVYGFAQFFNLSFTHYLNPYYTGGEHIDMGLERARRVYSTMGNANVLGQFLTWSLVAYTMALLSRIGSRALNSIVVLSSVLVLVMTGSRYGLLTAAVGLLVILLMTSGFERKRLAPLIALVLLLPAFGAVYAYIGTRYSVNGNRFEELKKPLEVRSLRERLDNLWIDAADYFHRSPILGNGPAKVIFTGVYTDSEYLNMLKYYGVVGFLPYVSLFLYPLYLLWTGLANGRRAGPKLEERIPAAFLVAKWATVVCITALVMNIGEFTYLNPLQSFLWMVLGLGAAAAQSISQVAKREMTMPSLVRRNVQTV